tara:strand:+ start:107 stop:376 length:270 start_codon:yes stop_codon:yes gene_type:complete
LNYRDSTNTRVKFFFQLLKQFLNFKRSEEIGVTVTYVSPNLLLTPAIFGQSPLHSAMFSFDSDNRSDKLESQPLKVKALSSDEQLSSIH